MPELVNDFIKVEEIPSLPTAKTKKWNVVNKRTLIPLGMIRWHSAWRQYIFAPESGCIFNQMCLVSINMFLQDANTEHRQIWAAIRSQGR